VVEEGEIALGVNCKAYASDLSDEEESVLQFLISHPKPGGRPCTVKMGVERSCAWLGRYRRLSKDYEYLPAMSEAWIYSVLCRFTLRRIARTAKVRTTN
jgi:hypothetical protein